MKLLLLALLAGCTTTSDGIVEADGEQAAELIVDGVDWALVWDATATERTDEGRRFTTNLGYVVTLEAGRVSTFSVTLDPCDEVTIAWSDLLVGTARAHHGEFDDPSLLELQTGEDLVDPGALAVEARFEAARYCGVHWSVARPDPLRRGFEGNGKARTSMALRGTWTRGETSGSFDYSTEWPDGQGREFGVDVDIPATAGSIGVTIERDLSGRFDGVELDAATEHEAAWAVLENLVGQYRVSVRSLP